MNTPHLKNRPEIDGLRALAVLSVLFYHAGVGFSGGFIGVDVFFVISGYLITGLILRDLENGQFQLREFWERRIRRILPALAGMVLISLVGCWVFFLPLDFKEFGQTMAGQALLVSNAVLWMQSGYFAEPAGLKPLLHTWSLAVEEQFYLLFPFLLMGLHRFARRYLAWTVVVLCLVSFCGSIYGTYRSPSATFFFLPTRAWELFVGACLAALPKRASPKWLSEVLSSAGLAAIIYSVFCYSNQTRFPGLSALLPCAGAGLFIWFNSNKLTFSGRFLASRPLVFVGLISYSLYLFHWPIIVFFKYNSLGQTSVLTNLMLITASFGAAILSWKFVETPFRKRLACPNRAQIYAFAGCVTTVMFLAGLTVLKSQGFPSRIPSSALDYEAGITDVGIHVDVSLDQALRGDFVELGSGDTRKPVDLLVWGDSHAMAILPVIDSLCKQHAVRGVAATHSGTAPLLGWASYGGLGLGKDSLAYNEAVVEFVHKNRVKNVLIAAYWNAHFLYEKTQPEVIRSHLVDTILALNQSGAKVWIMKQVPEYPWNVPRKLAHTVLLGGNPEDIGLPVEEHNKAVRLQAPIFFGVESSNAMILDPTDCFLGISRSNMLSAARNGHALYSDSQHLSTHGAMELKPILETIFQ